MVRLGWVAVLTCGIGACAPDQQLRVREYNDDGVFLFQQGDYKHARETFEAALALRPGDANLWFNIGECQVRAGQGAAAEHAFAECLKVSPNHAECRHALTAMLYDQGRREEAVSQVADWMRANPRLSSPYVEDAYLWHRYGDLPKAVEQLQTAIALDPRDPYALAELGRVNEDLNLTDRAVILYERSLQIHANQPDVTARLAALRARGVTPPPPQTP